MGAQRSKLIANGITGVTIANDCIGIGDRPIQHRGATAI